MAEETDDTAAILTHDELSTSLSNQCQLKCDLHVPEETLHQPLRTCTYCGPDYQYKDIESHLTRDHYCVYCKKYLTKNDHEVQTESRDLCDFRNCGVNLCSQVKLEWHSLVFCSLGAIAGMIFGLEVLFKNNA